MNKVKERIGENGRELVLYVRGQVFRTNARIGNRGVQCAKRHDTKVEYRDTDRAISYGD